MAETRDEWRAFIESPAHPAMREGGAEAFGRRNAVPGGLLVRVTPTRVVTRTNVSD